MNSSEKFANLNSYIQINTQKRLIDMFNELEKECKRIKIAVAYITNSGVKNLEKIIRNCINSGGVVKVITGTQGIQKFFTEYQGLQSLHNLGVKLKIYEEKNGEFHCKFYLFKDKRNIYHVFIGSSNISESAYTNNVEINFYHFGNKKNPIIKQANKIFKDLWNDSKEINQEYLDKIERREKYNKPKREKKYIPLPPLPQLPIQINQYFINGRGYDACDDKVLYFLESKKNIAEKFKKGNRGFIYEYNGKNTIFAEVEVIGDTYKVSKSKSHYDKDKKEYWNWKVPIKIIYCIRHHGSFIGRGFISKKEVSLSDIQRILGWKKGSSPANKHGGTTWITNEQYEKIKEKLYYLKKKK